MVLALMGERWQLIDGLPNSVSGFIIAAGLMAIGFLSASSHLGYRSVRARRVALALSRPWTRRPGCDGRSDRSWSGRALAHSAGGQLASSSVSPARCSRWGRRRCRPPSHPGGFYGPSTLEILATSGLGYAGILFGIWWMRRIYLAPLETDPEARWRYRDR